MVQWVQRNRVVVPYVSSLLTRTGLGWPSQSYPGLMASYPFFLNPGLMECPFLPPPAQIASAGQLNKIKQTNGIPQSLSPLTVESWCKHQWKTMPHEYTNGRHTRDPVTKSTTRRENLWKPCMLHCRDTRTHTHTLLTCAGYRPGQ